MRSAVPATSEATRKNKAILLRLEEHATQLESEVLLHIGQAHEMTLLGLSRTSEMNLNMATNLTLCRVLVCLNMAAWPTGRLELGLGDKPWRSAGWPSLETSPSPWRRRD
jgi:hypothetical protein